MFREERLSWDLSSRHKHRRQNKIKLAATLLTVEWGPTKSKISSFSKCASRLLMSRFRLWLHLKHAQHKSYFRVDDRKTFFFWSRGQRNVMVRETEWLWGRE